MRTSSTACRGQKVGWKVVGKTGGWGGTGIDQLSGVLADEKRLRNLARVC